MASIFLLLDFAAQALSPRPSPRTPNFSDKHCLGKLTVLLVRRSWTSEAKLCPLNQLSSWKTCANVVLQKEIKLGTLSQKSNSSTTRSRAERRLDKAIKSPTQLPLKKLLKPENNILFSLNELLFCNYAGHCIDHEDIQISRSNMDVRDSFYQIQIISKFADSNEQLKYGYIPSFLLPIWLIGKHS